MTFHVGQKVVFVGGDRTGPNVIRIPGCLKKGDVYTVREIDPIYIPYFGHPGIRVEEFIAPSVMWRGRMVEACRTSDAFRPLIERKTDISIFTEMLTPKVRALEDIGT